MNCLRRSNTGIVGSNPNQGMGVCVRLFCVCVVLFVVSVLATGWSLVQGVLPTVYYYYYYYYYYCSTTLYWALAAFSVSWSSTLSVELLGRGISPSQGRYLYTAQHKHRTNTDIHASIGFRTHDPSVRASEDSSCLRQRGHCDRHLCIDWEKKRPRSTRAIEP
jgi:hypothetical protein